MFKTAIKIGVPPRAEIATADQAKYCLAMGGCIPGCVETLQAHRRGRVLWGLVRLITSLGCARRP